MKAKRSAHFVLSAGLAVLGCMGVVDSGRAQLPAVPGQGAPTAAGGTQAAGVPVVSSNLVEERLAKARADLAVAETLEELSATNRSAAGSVAQETVLRRSLLETLVRLYEQQLAYVAELAAAKSRRAELAHEAQSWTGFAEPRPYSILLTDGLHESIQLEQLEKTNGEAALLLLAKLIDEHRASLKEAEEKLRQFNEQLEGDKSAATANRLAWPRELERLRSQRASAFIATLELERQIRQERLAAGRVRLGLLRQQLVLASASATLTDADMTAVQARLDADQRECEGELARAQSRQGGAIRAFEAAKEALRRAQAQPDVEAVMMARLTEEFELRRAQVDTINTELNALRSMLQIGTLARTVWEVRYAAFRSPSAETIRRNKGRLEQFIRRVQLWQTYYRQESEIVASQLARLEARIAGLDAASDIAPILQERMAALRDRDHILLRLVREVEQGERQIQRLDEELREAAGNLPFLGRLRNAFSGTRSFLAGLWDLELFVAQDTVIVDGEPITGKRSITLGKVISAILILVVGYWLAGLVSGFAEPIFIKRFKIEPNQANLIRRWLRVLLVLGLTLFSLVSVKIPLTIFAFAGGALAIGLGFGLQTLLKNFVSGIIILFERPFRVGDVLDVAGQRGTVSSVGIRSSVLQSWDGTEVLIPNSTLLETNVTNWTYSNRAVRFNLSVGVAYGSDTRRVVQVLGEIVDRHGQVEKDPKPQVLFTEFGESALNFELRFWVDVVKANSAQIASDLRQMIAGTFAEHGIVIAFPQRDIHLDAARPVPVQIVAPADSSKSDGETAKPSVPAGSAPEPQTEGNAAQMAKHRPSTSAESKEAGLPA